MYSQQLSYDAGDRLLKQIDALGQTVAQFNYDNRDNLTRRTGQ